LRGGNADTSKTFAEGPRTADDLPSSSHQQSCPCFRTPTVTRKRIPGAAFKSDREETDMDMDVEIESDSAARSSDEYSRPPAFFSGRPQTHTQ
jgi:hypothetical protein